MKKRKEESTRVLRVDSETHKRIKELSITTDWTMGYLVRMAISSLSSKIEESKKRISQITKEELLNWCSIDVPLEDFIDRVGDVYLWQLSKTEMDEFVKLYNKYNNGKVYSKDDKDSIPPKGPMRMVKLTQEEMKEYMGER